MEEEGEQTPHLGNSTCGNQVSLIFMMDCYNNKSAQTSGSRKFGG